MLCKECDQDEISYNGYVPGKDVASFICSRCTAKMVPAPEEKPKVVALTPEEKEAKAVAKEEKKKAKLEKMKIKGRGKGWHLKRLFEFDGKFYSFGKEIDAAEAFKIKKDIKDKAEAPKL